MSEEAFHASAAPRPAQLIGRLRNGLAWLAGLALLSVACLPAPPLSPTPVPTLTGMPTVTPSPTTTIVWFPPTSTFTPFPTIAILPTEDARPDRGPVILEDDFTDLAAWPTMRTTSGSVAYGNQELTLAAAVPNNPLLSLRQAPIVSDFYLEIDALPSLCRGGDTYGLLLRAASTLDSYRLLVNCIGQLRMERLKEGRSAPVQDWITSGQMQPGGMMRVRLGVWAFNNEIQVFVNDVYQFAVHDPVWSSGQIGVFARSAGDTPLTVNFSNLAIYQVPGGRLPPAMPTFRAVTPTPDPGASQTVPPRP